MPAFICNTCGTQYEPAEKPPANCPICTDERQYVAVSGQSWTTHDAMTKRYYNAWRELEPNLYSIATWPAFGINQRAQLLCTPNGNMLWDCIALSDPATVALIKAMGGIKCVAISHPHYYTTMVEWARAFDVPVYIHALDRKWIMRNGPGITPWEGETKALMPGVTLVRCGGHYPGGVVLHWAEGAGGKGAVLSGDILQVVQDQTISFMWSFPNFIPLSAPRVRGVVAALKPYAFDRVHGAFSDRSVWSDGKAMMERCAERYIKIILGDGSYELNFDK